MPLDGYYTYESLPLYNSPFSQLLDLKDKHSKKELKIIEALIKKKLSYVTADIPDDKKFLRLYPQVNKKNIPNKKSRERDITRIARQKIEENCSYYKLGPEDFDWDNMVKEISKQIDSWENKNIVCKEVKRLVAHYRKKSLTNIVNRLLCWSRGLTLFQKVPKLEKVLEKARYKFSNEPQIVEQVVERIRTRLNEEKYEEVLNLHKEPSIKITLVDCLWGKECEDLSDEEKKIIGLATSFLRDLKKVEKKAELLTYQQIMEHAEKTLCNDPEKELLIIKIKARLDFEVYNEKYEESAAIYLPLHAEENSIAARAENFLCSLPNMGGYHIPSVPH